MTGPVKKFFPNNRIEELVRRPGGVSREQALTKATAAVASLREESIADVAKSIATIGKFVENGRTTPLNRSQMRTILWHCDRIIVLAGTYDLEFLAGVAMRFCDLLGRFVETGEGDLEAVAVFLRSLRLAAPPSPPLDEHHKDEVLRELSRILIHCGVRPAILEHF